ncbi:DUF6777 domain-containing protein [Streptomyces sp. NBC_01750]|uniref:DUF6777 domain-containing protein n=1 Tax=Streptomyces sp. NBC_01750 TaxID=2975928 RepID=UPI002DDA6D14|nr:DUF6777 domain-containing protein [Streptomyces sp. NBC_01750]WSD31186.1 hypothetical protein OG966_04100 [Streptomyces sp. NBC_01750]
MSAQPPPSERPTGPPSGPLSGPSRPGSTPPPGPVPPKPPPSGGGFGGTGPGGTGGTGGPGGPPQGPGEGPGHPWWRSVPRIAAIAAALVVAVVLTIVFTRPNESAKAAEVVLEPAGSTGPDPFTESTARESTPPPTLPRLPSTPANATRSVRGSTPGLYTGTRKVASCDVEKQVSSLTADPAKNRAFASVHGIAPAAVPAYLRSLTPVQLGMDTRVTNHGYKNGATTSYQAVLQAGTAVLVDGRGVPQVRCGCGNPLRPLVPLKGTPKPKGDPWPAYRPSNVVVVAPSVTVVNVFIVFDPHKNDWFSRDRGDTGRHDKKTSPPVRQELPRFPDTSSPSPGESSPSPGSSSPSPGKPNLRPESSEPPASPAPGSSTPSPAQPNLRPESSEPPASPPPGSSTPSPGKPNLRPESSEPPTSSLPAPPPPAVPESPSGPASGSESSPLLPNSPVT